MLHRNGLNPALTGKMAYQVGASMAATVIAFFIFAGLPKFSPVSDRQTVELTSGGKFASRIPGAALPPADPQQSGDRPARLPSMTLLREEAAVVETSTASPIGSAWGGLKPTTPVSADKAVTRTRPARPAMRGDARHLADAGSGSPTKPAQAMASKVSATGETSQPREEDSVLPRIWGSARSVWMVTASTGVSLLSHVIPQ